MLLCIAQVPLYMHLLIIMRLQLIKAAAVTIYTICLGVEETS